MYSQSVQQLLCQTLGGGSEHQKEANGGGGIMVLTQHRYAM